MTVSHNFFFFSSWVNLKQHFTGWRLAHCTNSCTTVELEATVMGSYWRHGVQKEKKNCVRNEWSVWKGGLYQSSAEIFFYLFPFLLLMELCDLCFGDSEGAGLVAEVLCHDISWGTTFSAAQSLLSKNKTNFLDPGKKTSSWFYNNQLDFIGDLSQMFFFILFYRYPELKTPEKWQF